jgi:hypothetical protein
MLKKSQLHVIHITYQAAYLATEGCNKPPYFVINHHFKTFQICVYSAIDTVHHVRHTVAPVRGYSSYIATAMILAVVIIIVACCLVSDLTVAFKEKKRSRTDIHHCC